MYVAKRLPEAVSRRKSEYHLVVGQGLLLHSRRRTTLTTVPLSQNMKNARV